MSHDRCSLQDVLFEFSVSRNSNSLDVSANMKMEWANMEPTLSVITNQVSSIWYSLNIYYEMLYKSEKLNVDIWYLLNILYNVMSALSIKQVFQYRLFWYYLGFRHAGSLFSFLEVTMRLMLVPLPRWSPAPRSITCTRVRSATLCVSCGRSVCQETSLRYNFPYHCE